MAATLPSSVNTNQEGFPNIFIASIIFAILPSLCANIYIVGLNQLTDIDIDRINKPNLPLAAGKYSFRQACWIVALMGSIALILASYLGPILLATVGVSMAIGTFYSLPPVRLKRFPFWAALCIFGVRGIVVNLGFFLYFKTLFTNSYQPSSLLFAVPPEVWTLTQFVVLFTLAIAFLKDIPDLEGDRRFHILTLTLRLGPHSVFRLSRWILTLCYLLTIALALSGFLPSANTVFLVFSQLSLLIILWWRSWGLNTSNTVQVSSFYQFVWKLFFLQYIFFPASIVIQG